MFSFVGSAVNGIVDKIVDYILPLDTFKFDWENEEYL